MINLQQLKEQRELVNSIDWNMTPEKAVEMYLEWGTSWSRGNDFVASSSDESIYFVLFDWIQPPMVTLIRRTVGGAEELGSFEVPEKLFMESWKEDGVLPGGTVHPPNKALKKWLCDKINGPPLDWATVEN